MSWGENARDARIVAAEQTPERQTGPARPKIPERDVDRRHGKGGEPAPADEVQAPPHALPQLLDAGAVLPLEERLQIVLDQRADRATPGADCIAVAEALDTLLVAQPDRDQLEMGELAVSGVRQDHQKLDAKEVGLDRTERHAWYLRGFGPTARVVDPGHGLP